MSVAVWYYCNLLDEVSADVPVVQTQRNTGDDVVAKAPAVRPAAGLALGVEVDDELAVGRSTYVLAAALTISKKEKDETEDEFKETAAELVVATETVVADTVKVEVAETKEVTEKIATEVEDEVEQAAKETTEVAKDETKQQDASPVETEPVAPVVVDEVEAEALDDAAAEVVHEVMEEALLVTEDAVTAAAEVEEDVSEVASEVETVHDAVETVVAIKEEITEPVAVQAADEEVKPVEVELATKDAASTEWLSSPTLSSEAPEQKLADKAEVVIEEPEPSIPEDEQSVHEDKEPTEKIIAADDESTAKEVAQPSPAEEQPASAKSVTEYESETETQSEISEATVEAAKVVEEPESEIDETMVIDPVVAAKEAAAVEAQTSSFSFIPEQIRKHSYAASSVAVAVTTAIVATLVARR
ncbi:hypothetical protein PInf_023015 [Phytophthora infestans]|nr:hypothetical protein PInf_023015 [Phytophthora infestans]